MVVKEKKIAIDKQIYTKTLQNLEKNNILVKEKEIQIYDKENNRYKLIVSLPNLLDSHLIFIAEDNSKNPFFSIATVYYNQLELFDGYISSYNNNLIKENKEEINKIYTEDFKNFVPKFYNILLEKSKKKEIPKKILNNLESIINLEEFKRDDFIINYKIP